MQLKAKRFSKISPFTFKNNNATKSEKIFEDFTFHLSLLKTTMQLKAKRFSKISPFTFHFLNPNEIYKA